LWKTDGYEVAFKDVGACPHKLRCRAEKVNKTEGPVGTVFSVPRGFFAGGNEEGWQN